MKLVCIYSVWDDYDLLRISIENMMPLVDGFVIVASEKSNYGEYSPIPSWLERNVYIREPELKNPMNCETDKRNYGLRLAKEQGYTHFIMMDADEFYNPVEFEREKKRFIDNPDLAGLVCSTQVFFKSPCLTIGLDTTRVPFIHKITPGLHHSFNRKYPFAWEGNDIKIDPTRSLSINSGVEWSDIVMLHYSWVRKDYSKKIRNSTARNNIERSTIMQDLLQAKEGYKVKFYGDKVLHRVPNYFNIPEYDVMV